MLGGWVVEPLGFDVSDRISDGSGMDKNDVVEAFRKEFKRQFDMLKRASDTARGDATDEESRGRSKYETQGLETSYLAAGQASRAEDLAAMAVKFNSCDYPIFDPNAPISEGALVHVKMGGESDWFLLAPAGGGLSIEYDGVEVTVLSPETPLRKELNGLRVGDEVAARRLVIQAVH